LKTRLPNNIFLYLLILLFLYGCSGHDNRKELKEASRYKEPLIKANKEVVKTESDQINDFVTRHHWPVTETPSGLRYWIYSRGTGVHINKDDIVTLDYTISLLTGDTIYTSASEGPMIFRQGNGQVISGLEEAVLLLHEGDKAKIVIPSHLAFGLVGDQKKIPQKSTLVYDIEPLETIKH
jgi:FKBP-type peptidyl-prolyl cis-trans isomerase FkpA